MGLEQKDEKPALKGREDVLSSVTGTHTQTHTHTHTHTRGKMGEDKETLNSGGRKAGELLSNVFLPLRKAKEVIF